MPVVRQVKGDELAKIVGNTQASLMETPLLRGMITVDQIMASSSDW